MGRLSRLAARLGRGANQVYSDSHKVGSKMLVPAECRVQSAEYEDARACRVQSVECRVQSAGCMVRRLVRCIM